MGVVGLVVVDGVGQGHQHRGQAGRGQLADSQRTRAADHQISPAIGMGHVLDERLYLSLDTGLAITLGGNLVMLLASLVEYLGTNLLRHLGQSLGQQFVQRFGTQASAEHQQTRLARTQGLAQGFHEQFAAHRVTGGAQFVRRREGVGESFADSASQRHQQPIGGTGAGVLLVNHHGYAAQPGSDAPRTGHVTTKANHTHRLELTNDPPRLQHGLDQGERRLEQRQLAFATQASDLDQVQLQAGLGHQFVFDTARGAQPVHAVTARLEFTGAGQRREHVAPGAACHDQYALAVSGHDSAPRQNRFH
ncbi:hypothetical protein D3C78_990840 [compost metagenome]